MDKILISENLAQLLESIQKTDDDSLAASTLDAIINSGEIDFTVFEDFAAELSSEDRKIADELVEALELRMQQRILDSSYSAKTGPNPRRRIVGTVKWFNEAKGFGFVSSDEQEIDVFVSANAVKAAGFDVLRAGQHIEFDLKTEDGRISAREIKLDN